MARVTESDPPTLCYSKSISLVGGFATGPLCIAHFLSVLNLTRRRNPTFKIEGPQRAPPPLGRVTMVANAPHDGLEVC